MEKSRRIREKEMKEERKRAELSADFRIRCGPLLEPILTEILTARQNQVDNALTNGFNEDETPAERVEKIRNLLKRGDFNAVARYIIILDGCNDETRNRLPINEQVLYFIVLLNTYLFDNFVSHFLIIKKIQTVE